MIAQRKNGFKHALRVAGRTQADVAKHLGKSRTYVSRRMAGIEDWTLQEAYTLCRFVGADEVMAFVFWPPKKEVA